MASHSRYEPGEDLSDVSGATRKVHGLIVSLMSAVDLHNQGAHASQKADLTAILERARVAGVGVGSASSSRLTDCRFNEAPKCECRIRAMDHGVCGSWR